MTFKPLKPYQPWYDDERDYNTNAPTYYDYLANSVNLEKVQTEAINELLVRDVNFQDSDEVHVDKLTNWHTDDDTQHGDITFKAHVITSPSSTTQTIDGVDYVTSNGVKVLHDGLYAPDYKKVLEKYSTDTNAKFTKITNDINTLNTKHTNDVSTINTKLSYKENKLASSRQTLNITHGTDGTSATTNVDTNPQKVLEHDNLKVGQKLVKTHNASSNDTTIALDESFINQVNKATSDVSGKQDKLTATNGVKLTDNQLELDTISDFNGDVDTLIITQTVRTTEGTTNLPTGESISDGLLEVVRVRDLCKQFYTPFNTKKVYVRSAKNADKPTIQWHPWYAIVDSETLNEAIKNVNKAYNLQNPEIYGVQAFSPVPTAAEGSWGIKFFNDTNSHIYNIKLNVGVIKKAGPGNTIAQQNISDLKNAGVPQDLIDKAKNGYVFRAGYYMGDSLNRIAFELKTDNDKMNINVKYYDGSGNIDTDTQIVEGHECTPIAITYNTSNNNLLD